MIKKMICVGVMLSLGVAGFIACGQEQADTSADDVLSKTELAEISSIPQSVPDNVVGEYLSEAGDGEILKLLEDGTFVAHTVTDLSSADCSITMTETVNGTYVETGNGTCSLTLAELTVKIEGVEDDPEMIEAYVDLMAGEDQKLREVYARLFGGEAVTGEELYGKESFDMLLQTPSVAVFDFENGTFAYQTAEDVSDAA